MSIFLETGYDSKELTEETLPLKSLLKLSLFPLVLALQLSGATLTHDYTLTSSLNDLTGSTPLNSDGGTITALGYSFLANQGLNVSNALTDTGDYSDTLARVVITRDAATKQVTGYVNGVEDVSFTDTTGDATFTGPNAILRFFEDDNVAGDRESSAAWQPASAFMTAR